MKKIVLLLVVFLFFYNNLAFAEPCLMPDFVKVGIKVRIDNNYTRKIVAIDKRICWIKTDNGVWWNVKKILSIEEK